MQLTRAADYAVRVMIHLASQPDGAVVPKAILAKAAEAPESFLAKILQSLSKVGLVQVRRGVEGGFSLLPRGAEASLLDVVEAIDGPIALNLCLGSGAPCYRAKYCAAHNVWVEAQAAMLAVLRGATIRSLVAAPSSDALLDITDTAEGSVVRASTTFSYLQDSLPKPSTQLRVQAVTGSALRDTGKHKP